MTDLPRLQRQQRAPETGIVHLGPGAFFRAFTAVYTDEVLRAGKSFWGILAVSLKSTRAHDDLVPQGCAYTAVEMAPDGEKHKNIEALTGVLVAPQDPETVIAAMADPKVKIVSLTITEKGYCHNPATGGLNFEAEGLQHDLAHPEAPQTALGFITAALARRRDAGLRPFTVLSCDNLPDNGATARRVITEFAALQDPELAHWIAQEVCFPATMVDRITPATTAEDIARLGRTLGVHDAACVYHEPFRQWVIEDDFVDGARPRWEEAGAQFVTSVRAHETMKLRCLNGTHSALAYLGYLAGHQTIVDTVSDTPFAAFCTKLWHWEILPTLRCPEGEDLDAYVASLLERYRNPAIQHRTWQIAMDGSQKLPQRLLGTIADNLAAGRDIDGLCLAVAGWMRYVGGRDEQGAAIDVRDPLAARLKAAVDAAEDDAGRVPALLAMTVVFPADLAVDSRFKTAVLQAYEALMAKGARAAVVDYVSKA